MITAVKVWWHCLLRTFEDGHAWCILTYAGKTRHYCECGYQNEVTHDR